MSSMFVCPSCGESCSVGEAFSSDVAEATGWGVCPSCGYCDVDGSAVSESGQSCPTCHETSPDDEWQTVDTSSDVDRESLVDADLDPDASYVQCPRCGALHDAYTLVTSE